MKIKQRFSGSVLFSTEIDSLKFAVEAAVKQQTDLSFADLRGTDLEETNLKGAYFEGAYLGGTNLGGADLEGANLRRANLVEADLKEADLRGVDLYGASLRGADLRGADLRGADLERVDLKGADLRGVYFEGANLEGANLDGAELDGTELEGAYLKGANGEKLKFVGNRPMFIVGPIGSRSDYLHGLLTDHGLYVKTGCFFGTHDEFIEAVSKTHKGNENEREYRAALKLIEAHADLWTKAVGR